MEPVVVKTLEWLTVGGGFALFGSGITVVMQYIRSWWVASKTDSIQQAFQTIHEIYSLMNTVLHETTANRISLMKASNGGSIPRAGVQLYASTVYETYQAPLSTGKTIWAQRPIDNVYLHHLINLTLNKKQVINYTTLEPGSELCDLFSTQNIKVSELHELFSEDCNYYYLQLDYLNEPVKDSAVTRELIRTTALQINKLFQLDRKQKKSLGV